MKISPHESKPRLVLYEPRHLIHNVAAHIFEEHGWDVFDVRGDMFIEDFCSIADKSTLVALGITGTGQNIIHLLHAIHRLSSMSYQIVVWQPWQDNTFKKFLTAIGVRHIFTEPTLYEDLTDFAAARCLPVCWSEQPRNQLRKRLTDNELAILLDISNGMSIANIANVRRCSIKTVHSLKRNARTRIGLEIRELLDISFRISQIQSINF